MAIWELTQEFTAVKNQLRRVCFAARHSVMPVLSWNIVDFTLGTKYFYINTATRILYMALHLWGTSELMQVRGHISFRHAARNSRTAMFHRSIHKLPLLKDHLNASCIAAVPDTPVRCRSIVDLTVVWERPLEQYQSAGVGHNLLQCDVCRRATVPPYLL